MLTALEWPSLEEVVITSAAIIVRMFIMSCRTRTANRIILITADPTLYSLFLSNMNYNCSEEQYSPE